MKVKQMRLSQGNTNMVTWVDKPQQVKKGFSITLKDVPGWWKVEEVFNYSRDHQEINRSWHVGGL